MAVASVKYVNIIGIIQHIEKVVKVCGASQNFHPDDALEHYPDINEKDFTPINTVNKYKEPLEKLQDILEKSKFEMNVAIDDVFNPTYEEIIEFTNKISDELGELLKEKKKLEEQLAACKMNIENTKHFLGLNIEFDKVSNCEYVKVNFGRLPNESFAKLGMYENDPYVEFFPCTRDENYCWGVYISPIEKSFFIDKIFSGLFFEHYDIRSIESTPEESIKKSTEQKTLLNQKLEDINYRVKYYKSKNYNDLIKYYSKLLQYDSFYSIINKAYQHGDTFVIAGWIPAKEEEKLTKQLQKIESIEIDYSDGNLEISHSPPIHLKNFVLFRPFEFYTSMYGLPSYNEFDPTSFVAITYILLFGIMFADLGQGLLLLLVALFMWKKKKMPLGEILVPCSFASMFFGLIVGSVFGFEEALNGVYKALFNIDGKLVNVMHPSTTNVIIISAVGVGISLLLIAMILNIISSIRQKHYGEAIFGVNGVAGFIFYTSLIVGLVANFLFGISIMNTAYCVGLVVVPLILIYLREPLSKLIERKKNWQPEKWSDFLVENLFEMIEVLLGYVTNTMSFLRVGAFVLVHAGMMEVVFVLAGMFGPMGYWVTIIVGNILVMALEGLIVGIQVLRLEFYEMFSRFYSGEGRAFKPIKIKNNI